MDVDALHTLVSGAIWRAEQLEDLDAETAPLAWSEVSKLEEALAKELPVAEPEGCIARRGAVRAALKAHNALRAQTLAEIYTTASLVPPIKSLVAIKRRAHSRRFTKRISSCSRTCFPRRERRQKKCSVALSRSLNCGKS